MSIEDLIHARLLCIAQMAATLEAGDRANPKLPVADSSERYVHRATLLFSAAAKAEATRTGMKVSEDDIKRVLSLRHRIRHNCPCEDCRAIKQVVAAARENNQRAPK